MAEMMPNGGRKAKGVGRGPIWAFAGIIVFWSAYFAYGAFLGLKPHEHGDMFGSLNTLFSGLAFGGVIVTILLQSRELRLQVEELRNSVEAQKQLVREARSARASDYAARLLGAYADWMTSMAAVREILAPTEPTEDYDIHRQDFLERAIDANRDLAQKAQLLALLDEQFAFYVVPKDQWQPLVDSIKTESPPGEAATPYDLLRAAIHAIKATKMPIEPARTQKVFTLTLDVQRLAALAYKQGTMFGEVRAIQLRQML